jgi:hypothetical protein
VQCSSEPRLNRPGLTGHRFAWVRPPEFWRGHQFRGVMCPDYLPSGGVSSGQRAVDTNEFGNEEQKIVSFSPPNALPANAFRRLLRDLAAFSERAHQEILREQTGPQVT